MQKARVACLVALAAGLFAAQSVAKVTLVRDGKPNAIIVIAAKPARNAQEAANELQHYIEKISGARLAIKSDATMARTSLSEGTALVLVGKSEATDAIPGLKIPHGMTKKFREEGFVIWCKADQLVLAGNDDGFYLGTRYAVCDLLERLGVRWFVPGGFGEVVPKMKTIVVDDMDVSEKPDFAIRDYWTHSRGTMAAERAEWKIHNKLSPSGRGWRSWLGVPGDGSVISLLPKDQFEEHPDWFALRRDGSRSVQMPCMTSPGMIDYLANKIKQRAANGAKVTAFAPADGVPRCYCDNCAKMSTGFDGFGANPRDPVPESSTSNEWLYFVNSIMDKVNAEYPDHLICTNGYANRDIPPELPGLNKSNNLVVMFANIGACTIHDYDNPHCWQMQRQGQMLKRWCELCDKVWIYNYNYTMLVALDTLTPMVSRIRNTIPRQKAWGMFGFFDQDEADWSMTGITTHYVRTKLQWNTKVDVDAVLDDYFDKWFGRAAKPMQAYYNSLENAFATAPVHGHEDVILPEIYTPALVKKLGRLIRDAEGRARSNTEKLHVRLERLMYDKIRYCVFAEQAKQRCDYALAAQHYGHMDALKGEMQKITPFFGYRPYPVYDPAWEKKRMERLLAKTKGPDRWLLLAILPEKARFRTDPHDDGIFERWQEPKYDDSKWDTLVTTRGWQSQGHGLRDDRGRPYAGVAWYRMTVSVPNISLRELPKDRPVRIHCPAVVNEAWVWVNGRYIGHKPYKLPWFRPSDFDMDITDAVKLGKQNQITIRVLCNAEAFGANGIYERMFIYSAADEGEAK